VTAMDTRFSLSSKNDATASLALTLSSVLIFFGFFLIGRRHADVSMIFAYSMGQVRRFFGHASNRNSLSDAQMRYLALPFLATSRDFQSVRRDLNPQTKSH